MNSLEPGLYWYDTVKPVKLAIDPLDLRADGLALGDLREILGCKSLIKNCSEFLVLGLPLISNSLTPKEEKLVPKSGAIFWCQLKF